jgi:putative transcriptional regulator
MLTAMTIETELRAPCFLVAVPQLGDPNFHRGVVLVLEHGEEGTMGLIINRPSTLDLATFCSSQNMRFKGDAKRLVYQGGPVQTDRAFILHASSHEGPETERVVGELRLSYSLESLRLIVDNPPDRLRVYLGYSGWGPNQLAEEITQGAWLVGQTNVGLVFGDDVDAIWVGALREMGIDPVQLMHSGAVH